MTTETVFVPGNLRPLRGPLVMSAGIVALTLAAALTIQKGYPLAILGDTLQLAIVGLAAVLFFQNLRHSAGRTRAFWVLVFLGALMWFVSLVLWAGPEILFREQVPDVPVADILLFVRLVPLAAAVALRPYKEDNARIRNAGLLDVSILILYSLYLYAFCVFAYKLSDRTKDIYDVRFNVSAAAGNLVLVTATAYAYLRATGVWKRVFGIYFLAATCYSIASVLSDVAIDFDKYYTGSLYDVPLVAAMCGFAVFGYVGGATRLGKSSSAGAAYSNESTPYQADFLSAWPAMLVTLSVPVVGIWLAMRGDAYSELRPFRMIITIVTMFGLTLLLSLKQDLLTESLVGSLTRLSATYLSLNRFKKQLTQNEKMASLGSAVARVSSEIRSAMEVILATVSRFSAGGEDSRAVSMSGKIAVHARRTDALVENMLRFAQETPLQFSSVEIKPLLESALQLSRVAKQQVIQVSLEVAEGLSPVRGDSSQLLHVFLQLISNAGDALEEVGGGTLLISAQEASGQIRIEFVDTGPGIKDLDRAFEPFYTTKEVGKGTGLGLSICYGIVNQHDGDITCRNRSEGGVAVTVLLPRLTPSAGALLRPVRVNAEQR